MNNSKQPKKILNSLFRFLSAIVLVVTLSSCEDFWEHVEAALIEVEYYYSQQNQGYGTSQTYILRGAEVRDVAYIPPATRGLSVEGQSFLKNIEKVNYLELNTVDPAALLAMRTETEKQTNKRGIELLHCNEENLCAFGRVKKGVVTDVSITGLVDDKYVVTAVQGSFNLEELRKLATSGELFKMPEYIQSGAQR